MAIQKKRLLSQLSSQQKQAVDAFEEEIDKILKEKYADGDTVTIDLTHWPHKRVREEISQKYQKAGWTVEFFDTQRDGMYLQIK